MKFGLLHTFTIKKRYIYNWVWRCIFGLKKKKNIFKTKDQLSRLKQQSLDTLTQGLFFKKKYRNREKKNKVRSLKSKKEFCFPKSFQTALELLRSFAKIMAGCCWRTAVYFFSLNLRLTALHRPPQGRPPCCWRNSGVICPALRVLPAKTTAMFSLKRKAVKT